MEPVRESVALVCLVVMDGEQDEHGNIGAGGTATNWMVPNGELDYLKDQLRRLFGEPVVEVLLPTVAQQLIEGMESLDDKWPGAVKFTRDDQ